MRTSRVVDMDIVTTKPQRISTSVHGIPQPRFALRLTLPPPLGASLPHCLALPLPISSNCRRFVSAPLPLSLSSCFPTFPFSKDTQHNLHSHKSYSIAATCPDSDSHPKPATIHTNHHRHVSVHGAPDASDWQVPAAHRPVSSQQEEPRYSLRLDEYTAHTTFLSQLHQQRVG